MAGRRVSRAITGPQTGGDTPGRVTKESDLGGGSELKEGRNEMRHGAIKDVVSGEGIPLRVVRRTRSQFSFLGRSKVSLPGVVFFRSTYPVFFSPSDAPTTFTLFV